MSFGGVQPYQHNDGDKYIAESPQYHGAPPSTDGPYGGVPPYNAPPFHSNNPFYRNQSQVSSRSRNAPIPHAQSPDSTDEEMLAEAQQHNEPIPVSDENEDAALAESLAWIPKANRPQRTGPRTPLTVPVVVPQISPGMQSSFSRAWAPILATHDVQPDEFLQFLDHLNVCKAASPPFQVLNLAGTVLGFTPIPFASLIGLGTSAAAGAGTYAVARVRITRYLERANAAYFAPRGLTALIAKQGTLPTILHQSPSAPLLAPVPYSLNHDHNGGHLTAGASLRDRRLAALGSSVAPLELNDLPPSHTENESNPLDKLSAKLTARKARKAEEKATEKSSKHREDGQKELRDFHKEEAKLVREMEKVERKEHGAKREEEIGKIEGKLAEAREKCAEKGGFDQGVDGSGGGAGGHASRKEEKAAKKFMFVVIMDAEVAKMQRERAEMAKRGEGGNPALR